MSDFDPLSKWTNCSYCFADLCDLQLCVCCLILLPIILFSESSQCPGLSWSISPLCENECSFLDVTLMYEINMWWEKKKEPWSPVWQLGQERPTGQMLWHEHTVSELFYFHSKFLNSQALGSSFCLLKWDESAKWTWICFPKGQTLGVILLVFFFFFYLTRNLS